MDSRSLLRKERAALCDTLSSLGPDAPTLCEGWTTADLAAHMVVREREPLAAAGILLPGPFADYNRRRIQVAKAGDYQRLIEWLRGGPYGLWRLGPMQAVNVGEYFVHHEDARRANGMDPRPPDPDLDAALWRMVRMTGRRQLRPLRGFGVLAQGPDGRGATLRKGFPEATITGAPGEIVLYLMGRKQAARVELSGSELAVTALDAAPLRA
ncbi:MAG TPA: TIGR03085 family metal-binding protein [Actinomycetes bacterium]|jgi:uncharacterized protein (TIGR03085 family)|nr:TIGR03085 family metal-binding protein [Actinomycetes bacterium]